MRRKKPRFEQADLFTDGPVADESALRVPQWVKDLTRHGNPMRATYRQCKCGELIIESHLAPVWEKYNARLIHGTRDLTTSILLRRHLDELRGVNTYSTLGHYARDGWYLETHDCLLPPVGDEYMEHALLAPRAPTVAEWEGMPPDGTIDEVEEFERLWRTPYDQLPHYE